MEIHIKINTRQKSVLISALRNPLEIITGLSHKLLIQNMRNHALVCNLHKIIQKTTRLLPCLCLLFLPLETALSKGI